MKKCNSCGYENPDTANFCKNCGKSIDVEPKNTIIKIPWWCQTWLIALCFATFILIIPAIYGIIAIIFNYNYLNKINSKLIEGENAENQLDDIKKAIPSDIDINDTIAIQNSIDAKKITLENLKRDIKTAENTKKTMTEQIKSMSEEINKLFGRKNAIDDFETEFETYKSQFLPQKEKMQNELSEIDDEIKTRKTELEDIKKQIIETNDEILYQECGLYEPKYIFENAEAYKMELNNIRQKQKDMIKSNEAVQGNTDWTVNGKISTGRKMVNDTQKLLLRAFNNECDTLVSKVKHNNYESYEKRMIKACETISKLGNVMSISITPQYLDSKLSELKLALDYQKKKEQEKEELREARERLREQRALQKEIDQAREKIKKEQRHYEQAMSVLKQRLEKADSEEKQALEIKKQELETHLDDIDKSLADIDYREANQRAGYVYIISNIGSFGKDIYKIGMTRRLEPMDRIYELGDASVPFRFDTHAMIFSDDAPALETALHRAFEDRKVNMINQRREFFRVTLDEIKEVVKENFDKTVEFIDFPEAEEYRLSTKMYD